MQLKPEEWNFLRNVVIGWSSTCNPSYPAMQTLAELNLITVSEPRAFDGRVSVAPTEKGQKHITETKNLDSSLD